MNQHNLVESLYSNIVKNEYSRFLINGTWGVGKTHICKLLEEKDCKVIHVSFFGKNSIESVTESIKLSFLSYKVLGKDKGFFGSLKKGFDFTQGIIGKNIDVLSLINLKDINNEYIVFFDDLERKSNCIEIIDALGIIEELAINSNVIVAVNLEKLNPQDMAVFSEFKEKIIEKQYKLNVASEEMISSILKNLKNIDDEFRKQIVGYHTIYCKGNLRLFIRSVKLINEISNIVDDKIVDLDIIKLCFGVVCKEVQNDEFDIIRYLENYNAHIFKTDIEKLYLNGEINEDFNLKYKNYLTNKGYDVNSLINNMKYSRLETSKSLSDKALFLKSEINNTNNSNFDNINILWKATILLMFINSKYNYGFNNKIIYDNSIITMEDIFKREIFEEIEEFCWCELIVDNNYVYDVMHKDLINIINNFAEPYVDLITNKYNELYDKYRKSYFENNMEWKNFYLCEELINKYGFDSEIAEIIFNYFYKYINSNDYIVLLYLLVDNIKNLDINWKSKAKQSLIDSMPTQVDSLTNEKANIIINMLL